MPGIKRKVNIVKKLPKSINTVEELDEFLSRPSEAIVDSIGHLEGDIIVLGAGGKIGPTLTRMAKRAIEQTGSDKEVIAVARRSLPDMEAEGIKTILCDMLELEQVKSLPKVANIIYMVGRKFGSTGAEELTWASNVITAYNVASVFTKSRIAVFSTGCVYPVVDVKTGGCVETDGEEPIGEYAMSCLGRERIFDYFSKEKGEKVIKIRLNYAVELRYGVPVDIATKVFNGEAVDVTTGFFNAIWQGDVCDQVLRSLSLADSPSFVLNITGPEIVSVRQLAHRFGAMFGKEAVIKGQENNLAYLNNASKANSIFGNPLVSFDRMVEWIADWVKRGGENLGKPTHFETQDGKY